MKLCTYNHKDVDRLGVVKDGFVIDLVKAHRAFQQAGGKLKNELPAFPENMLSLLQGGDALLDATKEIMAWVEKQRKDSDLKIPLENVALRAPISNVSKVIGIGLNYADHCREGNVPLPKSIILFAKFPSSIIGPGESITWDTKVSKEVDYEAELGVVIGNEASRIGPEVAWNVVAGYTIANDVSARDVQFADKQWVRGKSFDTFCPIGPYLVTRDEIPDPDRLTIQTRLNGQVVQDSNTREMIFKVPDIVSFISKSITLFPGDIICTGTPAGVGYFHDPKMLLKPGDVVEIEIEGLGVLKNPVV